MGIEKRGAEFIPSDLRMFALQLLAVIQRDPSCAGFQFSPAFEEPAPELSTTMVNTPTPVYFPVFA